MLQFVFLSALFVVALASNPAGQAYLEKNSEKDNVLSLPSGLQYEIIRSGPISGSTPKSASDSCTCHYEGKLIDGTIFDSSIQRGSPSTFSPSGVIGGWTEALMLMRPGDKWILTIPSNLAYGDRGSGSSIPGGAVLIFSLELISVKESSWTDWLTPKVFAFVAYLSYMLYSFFSGPSRKDVTATKQFSEKFLSENKAKDGVISLPSGLQYKVLRQGKGTGHPLPGTPCSCHYEGRCAADYPSGKKFDSSYDRGSPTTFAPNQVISGWTEAMQLMVEGDKWEMYIPSNLAYGDQGKVPGCLVFTMEIIKILGNTRPSKKDD